MNQINKHFSDGKSHLYKTGQKLIDFIRLVLSLFAIMIGFILEFLIELPLLLIFIFSNMKSRLHKKEEPE